MTPEEMEALELEGGRMPRGITLDPIDIVGDPDGDDSELREAERAERARARGYDTAEDAVASRARKGNPAAPHTLPTGFDRAVAATTGGNPVDIRSTRDRLTSGVIDYMDADVRRARASPIPGLGTLADWADSGTSGATGAVDGASLGFADEIGGAVSAAGAALGGDDAGEAYEATRDRMRARSASDAEASPWAYGLGATAGALATTPFLPGVSAGRGAPLLTRLSAGALEGAAYGALGGAGFSEGETAGEVADDSARGAMYGLGAGALGSAAGEGVSAASRAMRRAAPASRVAADRARVASVVGTGNAPMSARMERDIGALPGGFTGAADLIRREGIGSMAGTVEGAATRATAATERTGERIGRMTDEIDRAMPDGVPVDAFTEALGRTADDLSVDPYTRELVPRLDRAADDWRAAAATGARADRLGSPRAAGPLPEGAGSRMTGPRAREAMGSLRSRVDFVRGADGPAAAGADLDAYRALRRAYDDEVEAALGPRGREYRPLRNDHAIASTLERYATDAAARTRRAPGAGLRGTIGGAAVGAATGSPLTGMAAAEGLGAYARRRPALEATGLEAVTAILERAPRLLGDYAEPLIRAGRRGAEVLAGVHAALMRRDPEYAATVDAATGSPVDEPFDWDSLAPEEGTEPPAAFSWDDYETTEGTP